MRKVCLIISLLVLSSTATAKLVIDDLKRMIDKSDIIVLAKPSQLSQEETSFDVILSYKGIGPESLEVLHAREVHDQRIRSTGNHILFLFKNNKGQWQASSYGRSYWPLLNTRNYQNQADNSCTRSVPKVYPFTMVSIEKVIKPKIKKVFFDYMPSDKDGVEMQIYCKEDIIAFITNHLTKQ